jgi:hypothetical protein
MKFETKIKYKNREINSTKIEISIQYAHEK